MPYGFNKELGGDSPENSAAIEACVAANLRKGMSKEQAIRICKAARAKHLQHERRKGS